jgi:cytochrome c-type biogenesis protein CcmH
MRRWLTPLAVVALVALAVTLLVAVTRPAPAVDRATQARQLAAELRCPDCQSLSVAESRTASADTIRREIDEMLAAGRTPDQVRGYFVARYGQWILLQPRDPLVWLLPIAALLIGAAAFGWWLRGQGGSAAATPAASRSASDEDRQRVRDELDALDG